MYFRQGHYQIQLQTLIGQAEKGTIFLNSNNC